jgi:hypothetical protein
MKKFAALAFVPFCAAFLWAQDEQTTHSETTVTKTTYNGTLMDASCRTTNTERTTSNTSTPDENTTKTETTHTTTQSTECPITAQTTAFGIMSSDGHFYTFDNPSNTKIVEMVKGNRRWAKFMQDRQPVAVRVVARPDGDVLVMDSIK